MLARNHYTKCAHDQSRFPFFKLNNSHMKRSLKLIKVTAFRRNHLLSWYLIFNFRPTFFVPKNKRLTLRRPLHHAWRKGLFYGAPRSHLQVSF